MLFSHTFELNLVQPPSGEISNAGERQTQLIKTQNMRSKFTEYQTQIKINTYF